MKPILKSELYTEDIADKARAFLIEEIQRLRYAPKLNGCPMTEEWEEQLEICEYLLNQIREE